MFGNINELLTILALLSGDEELGADILESMQEEAGCSTCDDPECPMSRVNKETDGETVKLAIEPGVTPLDQFPDEILAHMAEGLEEARKKVAEENGYKHHMYIMLRDELKRVNDEIESRDPLYPVKMMVKSVNKTFGKPQMGDLAEYLPEVKKSGDGAEIRIKLPTSNNEWQHKVNRWTEGFVKRFGNTWHSNTQSNDPLYTYIFVSNHAMKEWRAKQ